MRNTRLARTSAFAALIVALLAAPSPGGSDEGAKTHQKSSDAAGKKPILRALVMKEPAIDDTAKILGIRCWSGSFELNRPASGARIAIDFYRDGKRVETIQRSVLLATSTDRGEFAVHLVDLDELPLGDRKRGHWRVITRLDVAGGKSWAQKDIPKGKVRFDYQGMGQASHTFEPEVGTPTEAPLFWVIYPGPTSEILRGNSPSELVEQNPGASLMIARLVFDEDKDARKP